MPGSTSAVTPSSPLTYSGTLPAPPSPGPAPTSSWSPRSSATASRPRGATPSPPNRTARRPSSGSPSTSSGARWHFVTRSLPAPLLATIQSTSVVAIRCCNHATARRRCDGVRSSSASSWATCHCTDGCSRWARSPRMRSTNGKPTGTPASDDLLERVHRPHPHPGVIVADAREQLLDPCGVLPQKLDELTGPAQRVPVTAERQHVAEWLHRRTVTQGQPPRRRWTRYPLRPVTPVTSRSNPQPRLSGCRASVSRTRRRLAPIRTPTPRILGRGGSAGGILAPDPAPVDRRCCRWATGRRRGGGDMSALGERCWSDGSRRRFSATC